MESTKEIEIEKIKIEMSNLESELFSKQEEINSLNANLDTKNAIINELTNQLSDKNTSFIKSSISRACRRVSGRENSEG